MSEQRVYRWRQVKADNSHLDMMVDLKNVEQIKDYGSASVMPVYGGKLNPISMVKALVSSWF